MQPEPLCKWMMAVLAPTPRPGPGLWDRLAAAFGPVDYRGEFLPFDVTDYYRGEFGADLHRGLVSFRGLGNPGQLPDRKLAACRLEADLAQAGKRIYNLDVGYLDADKLVLASLKPGPCKMYLRDGVYGDLLLKYADGRFEPMPWAFADFQDGRYGKSLLVIREKLKSQARKSGSAPSASP